jgi:hypothetical protein
MYPGFTHATLAQWDSIYRTGAEEQIKQETLKATRNNIKRGGDGRGGLIQEGKSGTDEEINSCRKGEENRVGNKITPGQRKGDGTERNSYLYTQFAFTTNEIFDGSL